MRVIALGVGGVGGDGNAPRRHDAEVGDAPFGAVLADEANPVAGLETHPAQAGGQQADLIGGLGPADGAPFARGFCAEEGRIALFVGAFEKQLNETVRRIDIRQHPAWLPLVFSIGRSTASRGLGGWPVYGKWPVP